jgi:hypothetical protein
VLMDDAMCRMTAQGERGYWAALPDDMSRSKSCVTAAGYISKVR